MEDISKQQQIFKSLFNRRNCSEALENPNNIRPLHELQEFRDNLNFL